MDIIIKKLTPALINDYLNFFDNVAFTDHKEWSFCYCMFFHTTDEMEEAYEKTGEVKNRDYAIEYINAGKMNGYLAYAQDKVVGWLNIDDKQSFYTLSRERRPELWTDNSGDNIKSAVCFLIAPAMRGRGIATRLLEKACADSKAEGYNLVEAYPVKAAGDNFLHYHGPISIYNKNGFSVYKELDDIFIVQKKL